MLIKIVLFIAIILLIVAGYFFGTASAAIVILKEPWKCHGRLKIEMLRKSQFHLFTAIVVLLLTAGLMMVKL